MRYIFYLCLAIWFGGSGCSETNFKSDGKSKGTGGRTTDDGKGGRKGPDTTIPDDPFADGDLAGQQGALLGLPKFGILANDLRCGLCHVKVLGDIASTADGRPARKDSVAEIVGKWFTKGQLKADDEATGVKVAQGFAENYQGKEVPASFPVIDFSSLSAKMTGSLKSSKENISKTITKNVVLIGTDADPVVIDKDVFISGDLVIAGKYKGIGTIYVDGIVYIPADIKAVNSAFPYSDSPSVALTEAYKKIEEKKDALGIASSGTIFFGGLDSKFFNDAENPGYIRADRDHLKTWMSASDYNTHLGRGFHCNEGSDKQVGSINVVDATLYARRAITGVNRSTSFAIRGAVVTDFLNILNAVKTCDSRVNPHHGMPSNWSYVLYDYRLKTAKLPILHHLGLILNNQ